MVIVSTKNAGAALIAALIALPAAADEKQAMIENALSAAPPHIAANAEVMNMKGEVLREGNGAFTCFPYEGPGTEAMCVDDEWMLWADAYMNKKEFKASKLGIAYMLAGDHPEGGASNIDPFATEKTPENQWLVEGPHLMLIGPGVTEGITDDPSTGGPYVMWKGTPYEHVMVPTAERPQ